MEHILLHKNIPVISFNLDGNFITEVYEILDVKHVPVGVFSADKTQLTRNLRRWWKSRSIPASRQNIDEALGNLGNVTTDYLISKCYGLSLSDHYWIKNKESSLEWEKVNFYRNEFSEDVGKALFGQLGDSDVSSLSLISPDNTSDGWLKKKWIIQDSKRFLVKGGSTTYQQEPFNEVLASEICRLLSFNHVEYNLILQNEKFYSECEDFTNEKIEYVSAGHIANTFVQNRQTSFYSQFVEACRNLGMDDIDGIEKSLSQMLILDFIIANTDRHLNNFGFLRNSETLEWLGLAPVFDSGTSMFFSESVYDLKNSKMHCSDKIKSKPFALTHRQQLEKIVLKDVLKQTDFEKLDSLPEWFRDFVGQNPQNEKERCLLLSELLKSRINEIKN